MNDAGAAVGMFVCAMLIVLPIALLIGAVILRSACHLASAKVPEVLPAMGSVLVVGIVNAIVGIAIGFIVRVAGANAGLDARTLQVIAQLISLPVGLFVYAALYVPLLKVSF